MISQFFSSSHSFSKNSLVGRRIEKKNFLHLQMMRGRQLKNRLGHTVVTMELMLWEIVLK